MTLGPLNVLGEGFERRPRPSAFGLLRQIRAIRTARLARQAEEEIALNQPAPRQPYQPPAPTPPTPDPSFLQNLRTIGQGVRAGSLGLLPFDVIQPGEGFRVPPLFKAAAAAGRIEEAINAPTAAFVSAGGLFAPPSPEQSRAIGQATRQAGRGDFGQAVGTLMEFQRGRPGLERFVTESISPVGLAGAAIPIGRVAKGVKALGKPAARAAVDVVRIPQVDEVVRRVNDPLTAERLNKIPGVRDLLRIMNPNSLADAEGVVAKFTISRAVYDEIVTDSAKLMSQRVLAQGAPKQLFQLGDDGATTVVTRLGGTPGESVFYNEIFQFPERFVLGPEQTRWLDNFADRTGAMLRYMEQEGVIPDAQLFASRVKGRYFPNMWRTLEHLGKTIELRVGGGRGLGVKQPFDQTRLFEDGADAITSGYRPGSDPMADVETMFRSMYKQVADKKLVDLMKPFGNTVSERMSPAIIKARNAAVTRHQGVRAASSIINSFSKAAIPPRAGVVIRGRAIADRWAPELMAELDAVVGRARRGRTLPVGERQRRTRELFRPLLTKVREELRIAQANSTNAKLASQKARRLAQARTNLGEVQFPMSGLAGRIFTPDDIIERVFPDSLVNNLKTLPRAQIEELVNVMRPQTRSFLDVTLKFSSMLRTLQAGLDFGVMLIHGIPTLLTRPAIWVQSMETSFKAMADPVAMARFTTDHADTVAKLAERNQLHGAGSDYMDALRAGGLIPQGLRRLEQVSTLSSGAKVIRKGLEGVERQFDAWLLSAKVYLWEAMEPMALRSANPQRALDELASHVSKMTGAISMANLGIKPTVRKLLGSFLMFAPRYRLATYGMMVDVTRGGLKGQLAREMFGKMLASGLLMYMAVSQRLGQEPHLDPTKGNFLTIKIGDTNVGIGSAYVSVARFVTSFLAQAITDGDTAINVTSPDNRLNRFVRGQLSPLSGTAWDIASGRNYIGEPTTDSFPNFFKNVALESLLPFWASGYADYPRPGAAAPPSEFFGLRSFPVSLWEQGVQLADIQAQGKLGKNYKDLNRLQQIELLRDNPEVQKLFDESTRVWGDRSTGERERINEYRAEQKKLREEYQARLDLILPELENRNLDPKRFREELKAMGRSFGDAYDRLNVEFEDAVQAINERVQDSDAHLEDVAYNEYMAQVVLADFENTDPLDPNFLGFNFQAREDAEERFKAKWGDAIWRYVDERRSVSRETPALLQELYDGRDALKSYWEVGELLLKRVGREDMLIKWQQYQNARGFEREDMEEEFPILKQTKAAVTKARQLRRENHQQTDAYLFRWGYTDTLRNPANKLLGEETVDRTPVRLE